MRKIAALIAASFVLAACASKPEALSGPPSAAKTIAIVSSVPPKFRVATTGVTIFENNLDIVDISDWRLDEVAASAATMMLSPRYHVVRATTDQWIEDTDVPIDTYLNNGLEGKDPAIQRAAREHVHTDTPVDLYLVICIGARAQGYSQLPNVNYAIGVSEVRQVFFFTTAPVVHTFLQMEILDGKTFNVLATMPLVHTPRQMGGLFNGSDDSPTEILHDFEWHKNWRDMTDAQHQLIHNRVLALLNDSIGYTIKKMKLVP